MGTSLQERLFSRVERRGFDECWPWVARSVTTDGYGMLWVGERDVSCLAHRISWEVHTGPIPEGLKVLHSCDNPPCVNPRHLFLGTLKDNTQDMLAKGRNVTNGNELKTHCPQGHEYTPENTRRTNGRRYCRECNRADSLKWYHRRKNVGSHATLTI